MKNGKRLLCVLLCLVTLLIAIPVSATSTATPGDLTGDTNVDNKDVEYLLWFTLFPEDYQIVGDADFNVDNIVDNLDVEYLLWYTLFPEDYPLYTPYEPGPKLMYDEAWRLLHRADLVNNNLIWYIQEIGKLNRSSTTTVAINGTNYKMPSVKNVSTEAQLITLMRKDFTYRFLWERTLAAGGGWITQVNGYLNAGNWVTKSGKPYLMDIAMTETGLAQRTGMTVQKMEDGSYRVQAPFDNGTDSGYFQCTVVMEDDVFKVADCRTAYSNAKKMDSRDARVMLDRECMVRSELLYFIEAEGLLLKDKPLSINMGLGGQVCMMDAYPAEGIYTWSDLDTLLKPYYPQGWIDSYKQLDYAYTDTGKVLHRGLWFEYNGRLYFAPINGIGGPYCEHYTANPVYKNGGWDIYVQYDFGTTDVECRVYLRDDVYKYE